MSGHHHHHDGHGHGHCHGEDDGHDHSNDITPAVQSLLYSQIQFDSIITLNGTSLHPGPFRFKIKLTNNLGKYRSSTKIRRSNCPENMGGAIK